MEVAFDVPINKRNESVKQYQSFFKKSQVYQGTYGFLRSAGEFGSAFLEKLRNQEELYVDRGRSSRPLLRTKAESRKLIK